MYTVLETDAFIDWVNSLRDRHTRIRLRRRLGKAARGNLGDVKPVGEGIWEMREFFGPGWRMYYLQRGELVIMMLGGGDKCWPMAIRPNWPRHWATLPAPAA
jgi:putative addiction module killer protein